MKKRIKFSIKEARIICDWFNKLRIEKNIKAIHKWKVDDSLLYKEDFILHSLPQKYDLTNEWTDQEI